MGRGAAGYGRVGMEGVTGAPLLGGARWDGDHSGEGQGECPDAAGWRELEQGIGSASERQLGRCPMVSPAWCQAG